MASRFKPSFKLLAQIAILAASFPAAAQEAAIRENLKASLPQFPPIQEVSKTSMPGLYEVRVNDTDIFYSDAKGEFLIQGSLIDVKGKINVTDKRTKELTKINFSDLDVKNAITIVRGNGQRKLAIFEDPNCSYCKKFERDNQKLDNITLHIFLLPILSPDSTEKSHNIWCAKSPADAWKNWMVNDKVPAKATCDTGAITRNLETAKKFKLTGTPTLIFSSGDRVPGAIPSEQIEKLL